MKRPETLVELHNDFAPHWVNPHDLAGAAVEDFVVVVVFRLVDFFADAKLPVSLFDPRQVRVGRI